MYFCAVCVQRYEFEVEFSIIHLLRGTILLLYDSWLCTQLHLVRKKMSLMSIRLNTYFYLKNLTSDEEVLEKKLHRVKTALTLVLSLFGTVLTVQSGIAIVS